jgi:hypothetical protein
MKFPYTILRGAVGLVKGVKCTPTRLLVKESPLGIVSMGRGVHARFIYVKNEQRSRGHSSVATGQ